MLVRWSAEASYPPRVTDGDAADLVEALLDVTSATEARTVEFVVDEILARRRARAAGLGGQLRGPLRADLPLVPHPQLADVPSAADVARTVEQLVPRARVEALPPAGALRSLMRAATSGLWDTVRITVSVPEGTGFVVVVPGRAQLIVESIAEAVDTAIAVKRRFAAELEHMRTISFDRSSHGFLAGQVAGEADAHAARVHVNADCVTPDGIVRLRNEYPDEEDQLAPAHPTGRQSAVDYITAHELWHHIDAVFQARRYRDSIEFRRRLGECLGVETLEQACGTRPGGPPAWQAARQRLEREVSAYATTNHTEATAEMFGLWWSREGEPSPVVRRFGELVDAFLPAS